MKKVFVFLFIFVALIAFSCNHSKIANDIQPLAKSNNIAKKGARLGTQAQNFVSSFYKNATYTIGKQVETSDNGVSYLVSEIIINDEARARGYITTDLAGENLTYFVDVDRVNFEMTNIEIETNVISKIPNINRLLDYNSTSEFDIIKVVEDNNSLPIAERRPCFGKVVEWSTCMFGKKFSITTYYAFWCVTNRVQSKLVDC
ncbi:MAG: hypothetical protein EAZ85_14245 [Bacteroidetes bacterium]|nr:MAG: hypothetical protein EAZ85_14245 [Bacteroidota bacterium]TAG85291.1 MAG: hypothetical protein EAZ20_15600 [Bacteroidota bacterium]